MLVDGNVLKKALINFVYITPTENHCNILFKEKQTETNKQAKSMDN